MTLKKPTKPGPDSNLPAISRPTKSSRSEDTTAEQATSQRASHELWLRLEAFLQMRSPNTQVTYRGAVSEWCKFLGGEPGSAAGAVKITAATELHGMAYRKWLDGQPGQRPRHSARGSSSGARTSQAVDLLGAKRHKKKDGLESSQTNATIAKKFAILRRIYRMLIGVGLAKANPFDSDRVPPPPKDSGRKRPTEMVDFTLVKQIVDSPDSSTPKGLRDRAVLAVLFGGGLRRSEAAKLRLGDLRKTTNGTTYLLLRATKAKRDAEAALPEWAAKYLRELLQHRVQKDRACEADYLFVGYSGQAGKTPTERPISATAIYRLFKQYCSAADAGPYCSPHSARATAITKLLAAGIPHRQVQEFSRHSSIAMVELYDKRRVSVDQNPGKDLEFE